MGCLNYENQFNHWFGNIHLSGPCNRSCYFCIGQHMMDLDSFNVLDKHPLLGLDEFIETCHQHNVVEINLTGTNTDPLLYKHTEKLKNYLLDKIPNLSFGIRTNGAVAIQQHKTLKLFNKGSISICSFDPSIYSAMMGSGEPPNLDKLISLTSSWDKLKINIILGPENANDDLFNSLEKISDLNIQRVNIREPYGQPHVGDILCRYGYSPIKHVFGMPVYRFKNTEVTYWDVHYVEVQSINLYAQGRVSVTYPITMGHSENGIVKDQSNFSGGRVKEQWVNFIKRKK